MKATAMCWPQLCAPRWCRGSNTTCSCAPIGCAVRRLYVPYDCCLGQPTQSPNWSRPLKALPSRPKCVCVCLLSESGSTPFRCAQVLPPCFPSVAPAETMRFLSTDFTELNTIELAEEIVTLSWRLFVAIKPQEWCAFARLFCPRNRVQEVPFPTANIASFGCESILSLLQFTNALKRWVQTTVKQHRDVLSCVVCSPFHALVSALLTSHALRRLRS
jgi:hypothetical protein